MIHAPSLGTSPAISIRPASPADAEPISCLYLQLVANPAVAVLPERIAQVGRDPNTALFVGESEGRVCATALVSLCADVMFRAQPFAVVENVVVAEDMRGQGIGAALFQHIEAFCCAAECSKIMLLSSAGRKEAHRFFEGLGFVGSAKQGFVKYRRQFSAADQS